MATFDLSMPYTNFICLLKKNESLPFPVATSKTISLFLKKFFFYKLCKI